ncbi:hypothetical protein Q5O89_18995 [Peribacillus frigoritolerans]|nr:hypothetical protein [Peribacillus frigoritolerans]
MYIPALTGFKMIPPFIIRIAGAWVTLKIIDTEEYTYIEGIGTATEEGTLDLEGLIKTLLQERYFRYL